jgi:hypothetical protein
VLDRYLARTNIEAQQSDMQVPAGRPDNLEEPVAGSQGVHGIFDEQAKSRSLQSRLSMYRQLAIEGHRGRCPCQGCRPGYPPPLTGWLTSTTWFSGGMGQTDGVGRGVRESGDSAWDGILVGYQRTDFPPSMTSPDGTIDVSTWTADGSTVSASARAVASPSLSAATSSPDHSDGR